MGLGSLLHREQQEEEPLCDLSWEAASPTQSPENCCHVLATLRGQHAAGMSTQPDTQHSREPALWSTS